MSRSRDTGNVCGLCDEFDVDQAAPEQVAQGRGRCLVRDERSRLALHVDWDGSSCVSFRLDRANLREKKRFVEAQRRARDSNTETPQIVQ